MERVYVNRAFRDLDALALSHARLDWARELRNPGAPPVLSRGRRLVETYVFLLAEQDGKERELDRRKVQEQIWAYIRTAPPPTLNALASWRKPKKPGPKQKAAGM